MYPNKGYDIIKIDREEAIKRLLYRFRDSFDNAESIDKFRSHLNNLDDKNLTQLYVNNVANILEYA